jgi:chromosome segregation ATPase
MPQSKLVERENLVKNYSYDLETKNISLKNDAKAKTMIDQLKSLMAEKSGSNRSDLDSQIQEIRNALTAHFKNLRDAALNIKGKNSVEESRLQEASANLRKNFPTNEEQAKLTEITTKLSDLAQEQVKYSSLKEFFDNQIRSIQDNPSYPNPNEEKLKTEQMKKELEELRQKRGTLGKSIQEEQDKLKYQEPDYDENKLAKMKSELEKINKRIKTIENILNPETFPTRTKEEPSVPEAKPKQQSNQPKKTVQEKIAEANKQLQELDAQLKKIAEDRNTLQQQIESRTLSSKDARSAAEKIETLNKKIETSRQKFIEKQNEIDELNLSLSNNKERSEQDNADESADW